MNIELLEQIKARILAEPDTFRMDVWSCGTAHCIAGHACLMSGVALDPQGGGILPDGGTVMTVAERLLDLHGAEVGRLFDTIGWPKKLMHRYMGASTRAEKAQIAAERIDYFIATKGAE